MMTVFRNHALYTAACLGLLFLSCEKLAEMEWDNPRDPQGISWNPPTVAAMEDTAVSTKDEIVVTAAGKDSNGEVKMYYWALDGENYRDSTESDSIKTAFSEEGRRTIRVKVRDDDGIFSLPDSVVITVMPDTPIVIGKKDTTVPFLPQPPDSSTTEGLSVILSWSFSSIQEADPLFNVYLDKMNPPGIIVARGASIPKLFLHYLHESSTYYWQVVAVVEGDREIHGPVWSFLTPHLPPDKQKTLNLFPEDKAVDVGTSNLILTWEGGDPDSNEHVVYDLYLSKEYPPISKLAQGLTVNKYYMPRLDNGATYYWKVTASDGKATSHSPVWQFKTAGAPNNPTDTPENKINGDSLVVRHILDKNGFSSIPVDEMCKFVNGRIEHLYLDSSRIPGKLTRLPAEIQNLTELRTLNLIGNKLTSLPAEIGNLTKLEWLRSWGNELTSLPAEIGKLVNLTQLWIGRNQLSSLPSSIGKLTKLEELLVFNNKLTSLPDEIRNLIHLTHIDLDENQLSSLPSGIVNLTNLTDLKVDQNKLCNLSETIKTWMNTYSSNPNWESSQSCSP